MDSLIYWIWLSLLNLSPRAITAVLQHCGDAERAYAEESDAFHGLRGITAREAEALENRDLTAAEFSQRRCLEQKLQILPLTDPAYPERLKQIAEPPAALYIQGEFPELDKAPVLAVIGTRRASAYGLRMSRELAFQIASGGATVLSLLTPGADEAAAAGMIQAGTPCIGVLGTAHEACRWPLMRQVVGNGAVVSEYPPGKEQFRHFFRERNRLAAGLSDGVVVVEAPEKSGTRLFVTEAAEQGKDVFAVPGNADAETAVGTLNLLKEGAKLVTCGTDVLEEYLLRFPELKKNLNRENSSGHKKTVPVSGEPDGTYNSGNVSAVSAASAPEDLRNQLQNLSADQLALIAAISPPATHVDDIVERSGLPVAKVLAQLTVLEIKGFVKREPGRNFSLNLK
ncbi:MAG: DNA-protecting protein DprA [Oscillospiraceae bacterium]|nr:DNA-protecting protein DprA [Oscillospiraceae bacterium]